ncbi:MAG TPA: DUF4252 domain-containing protein [Tenuifilaceae bacterium]|nr:DUF4252 domain-containing protein [Tenuifilaceae bacterium]HPJ46875.1 DUF4252 domain-containing protein [Tenuifilaceae bacterium]HPQ34622.1 DUF4252 domain-containing protein [Tenuifilaceae bacterium]HRX68942.1 DUF4252 domain-containing protein [Tenuifilaceae bacterium]
MKRLVLLVVITCFSIISYAQVSPDAVFEKYAGKSGFTSINFNSQIFKLIAFLDDSADEDLERISENLSGLKIIVCESDNPEFRKDINALRNNNGLVKLMEVVESTSKVNFYAKYENGFISNLVLIAMEEGEDVLMSISGKFKMEDLAQMGSCTSFGSSNSHIALLRNLEEK